MVIVVACDVGEEAFGLASGRGVVSQEHMATNSKADDMGFIILASILNRMVGGLNRCVIPQDS